MVTIASLLKYFTFKMRVCVVGIIGLLGCSRTPDIYTMDPEYLEAIRSSPETIGVTASSYSANRKIAMPAKGVTGGIKRGVVVGASTPVVLGFLSPIPGGTALGVLVAPYFAAAGGVYGARRAVPADEIEEAEEAIDRAAEKLREMNLSQAFVKEIVKQGEERTDLRFIALTEIGPGDPNEVVQYDKLAPRGIDTVMELRFESNGLRGLYSFDPPSFYFIEVEVRLIRTKDNEILLSENFVCTSEEQRKYTDWARNEGQLIVDALISFKSKIAEKIIDDIFLVYPIASR